MTDIRDTRLDVRWAPSSLTRALATCVGVGLIAAVIGSRWQLVTFIAPMIGVLASIGWQREPGKISFRAEPGVIRCFENEHRQTTVQLLAGDNDTEGTFAVTTMPGMRSEVLSGGVLDKRIDTCAERWGGYPLRARAEVVAPGGLLTGVASADVADIYVFPIAPTQLTALPRTEMPDRLGSHLTRHVGPGVEFADIRPFVPGDQLRTVNWAVSARRGSLHVNQRLTDRAADVVVIVDMSAQPAGLATAATERAVRGATQVVQTALRDGDRAGIIGFGGRSLRWLGADIGQRQFYRILDTVLGVGAGHQSATGTLAPPAAIPPGAVIVAFSTLLETSFALALVELHKRGHAVVAIDVLDGCPLEGQLEPLLERMWGLQRSAMCRDMRVIGVEVISWPTGLTLDRAMAPLRANAGRLGRRWLS